MSKPSPQSKSFATRYAKFLQRKIVIGLVLVGIVVGVDISGKGYFLIPYVLILPVTNEIGRQAGLWFLYFKKQGRLNWSTFHDIWKIHSRRAYYKAPWQRMAVRWVFLFCVCFALWTVSGLILFLYLGMYSLLIPAKRFLRLSRPPAVLFLGASSRYTTSFQLLVSMIVSPLQAVSLLSHQQDVVPRGMDTIVGYRTSNEDEWKDTVSRLIQLAPFVMMDVTEITPAVEFEIERILKYDLAEKTIFLANDVFPSQIPKERCFTIEKGIAEFRNAWMGKVSESLS